MANKYGRKKISHGTRRKLMIAAEFTCQKCGWRPSKIPENYDGKTYFGDDVQVGWMRDPRWSLDPLPDIPKMVMRTLQIDHVHPVKHGGTNELSNLQVLCTRCNCSKGAGY